MTTHCPGCTKCTLAVNPCQGLPSHKAVLEAYREHRDAKAQAKGCMAVYGDTLDFAGAVRASARIMRAWDVLEAELSDLDAKEQ